MKIDDLINNSLDKSRGVINETLDSQDFRSSLLMAANSIIDTYNNGGKVLLAETGEVHQIVSMFVQNLLVDLTLIGHPSCSSINC